MKQFLQKEPLQAPTPPVFGNGEKFFPLPRRSPAEKPGIHWHFSTAPVHPCSALVLVLTGLDPQVVSEIVLLLTSRLGIKEATQEVTSLDEITSKPPFATLPAGSSVPTGNAPLNKFFTVSSKKEIPNEAPFFKAAKTPITNEPPPEKSPLGLPTPFQKKLLESIHRVIEGNLENEKFRVTDLAKALNCCIMQLHRIMKDLTGHSAGDYIRNYRLQKSLAHLQSGEHNVCQVAYLVGFKSPEHFARSFRKAFGKSPSDCRCRK